MALERADRGRRREDAARATRHSWTVAAQRSSEDLTAHVAWRLRVAEEVEAAYGKSPELAAAAVGGSVGAGLADRWSDLEIDCYWRVPPSEGDRLTPIRAMNAVLEAFWEFDEGDQEWSEEYRYRGLSVTVSNFTVATVEEFLEAVLVDGDLDPVKHFRLAALGSGRALRGAGTLDAWRHQLARFPDTLVRALVEAALHPDRLPGWAARQALAERGDTVAVHSLLAAVELAVLGAVLAINRIFQPHRLPKWQRQMLGKLPLRPAAFAFRLEQVWRQEPLAALASAEALVYETLDLAERELSLRLDHARDALAHQRHAIELPGSS